MGVEEVQKTLEITIKIALWKELQGVKLVQKVRFTCTEPNFDVCVVLREAGVKRDMCKKHGKHCEKLVCRHVLTRLVHFDVSSCFYIAPKTGQLRNLVPRYANTNPRRPNIEPRKAQRSSKIAPRWIPFLTKIWSPFGPTFATKIPQKGRALLGQALPKYQSTFYVSRPDIVLCTPAWLERSSLFKTVLVFIFAFVLLRVIFFQFLSSHCKYWTSTKLFKDEIYRSPAHSKLKRKRKLTWTWNLNEKCMEQIWKIHQANMYTKDIKD